MAFLSLLIVVFLLFGRPQEFFTSLQSFRPSLIFIIITFTLTFLARSDTIISGRIFTLKESKRYLLFFAIMIAGIPFASHRRMAFDFIFFQYTANILFFFLLLININTAKKLKITIFMVCASILFFNTKGLLYYSFSKQRFFTGTMYDPNDMAFILVATFPLFFLFIKGNQRWIIKLFGLAGILLTIPSILFTESRGGFIGLSIIFFYFIFSKILTDRLSVKLLVLILLGIILSVNIDNINFERIQSITDLSSDYNVTSETGRLEIWTRGLKMAFLNPVTGVGAGCFARAIGYQREKEGVTPEWQAPHNSYLQILSECGFIGFIVFISLISTTLQNYRHISGIINEDIESAGYSDAAKVLKLGFVGSLFCAFFLTQAYSILFTLFFALSATLRRLYTSSPEIDNNGDGLIENLYRRT